MKTSKRNLLLAALVVAQPAYAWDGVKSGKITTIQATDGVNFAWRIYLDGSQMCNGSPANWAYMNTSYDNYQATAALLTSAWLAGKTAVIYTNNVGGNCQIGYVSVS